jgi:hypothetical protein
MQPTTQRATGSYRSGLASQDKERRLKRVFDVVFMLENRATGRNDHRSMTGHQRLERRPVVVRVVSRQELAIAEADNSANVEEVAEVPQRRLRCTRYHDFPRPPEPDLFASCSVRISQAQLL